MEYKEILENLGVLKKFYTATDKDDKTIFYRGVDQQNGKLIVTKFDGKTDEFDLRLIQLISINKWDGLLIHYNSLDGRKMYPYRLLNITDIEVHLR